MRILIVKLGSIGDIIHTLPALAALRRALPRAQISWVVERRSAEILRDNPALDRLIEIDTKALRRWPLSGETLLAPRQQLHRLRASTFDLALDFQGLLKSALIARLSGAHQTYGYSRAALREPASRFLLGATIPIPPDLHIIRQALALVKDALGIPIPTDSSEFEFPIARGHHHEVEATKAAHAAGGEYAILNPGGGWPTKMWSAERFGALADRLWDTHGLASIVTYGPGEQALAEQVVGASSSGKAAAVSLSLKGLYTLAREARLYIGGDTGPTHLAMAAGAPVVGLFGPTEWWRNGSPRPADICVERNDIGCRENCHRRSCAQWICMDIGVERVLGAATLRLSRVARMDRAECTVVA